MPTDNQMLPLELSQSPQDTYDSFPPLRAAHGNRTWGSGFLPSHRPDGKRKQQQKFRAFDIRKGRT